MGRSLLVSAPKPRAEGSIPSAPATLRTRKSRKYVICGFLFLRVPRFVYYLSIIDGHSDLKTLFYAVFVGGFRLIV